MVKKIKGTAILLIILSAVFSSCSLIQTGEPTKTGVGKVVISVTDAPFPVKDVKNVFVNVDKVELRVSGGLCNGTNGEHIGKGYFKDHGNWKSSWFHYENFDCDSGFVTVFSATKPVEIDLLKLQNGLTSMLAKADIPVGSYDIIRLHLVNATIVLENATITLNLPSSNASGLKIRLDSDLVVEEGDNIAEVLLDFDLSRSFIAFGYPGGKKGIMGFFFNPVIRAINHPKSGTIFGTVYQGNFNPVEGALVTVLKKDTIVTTAITNSKGFYKVIGLPVGIYNLKAEKEGYTTANIKDINVICRGEIMKNIQLVQQK
jgi:hypothetical protein